MNEVDISLFANKLFSLVIQRLFRRQDDKDLFPDCDIHVSVNTLYSYLSTSKASAESNWSLPVVNGLEIKSLTIL